LGDIHPGCRVRSLLPKLGKIQKPTAPTPRTGADSDAAHRPARRGVADPSARACDDAEMSSDGADNGDRDAALRWIIEQMTRSVEDLERLDLDMLARVTGLDPDRAREYLERVEEWLRSRAEDGPGDGLRQLGALIGPELLSRFTRFAGASGANPAGFPGAADRAGGAPHPLDVPTLAQGRALSAIDSGRWSVPPGSHTFIAHDGSEVADGASELIGELRARDWINATGTLTQVGQHALARWIAAHSPQ
jgi:hypothetical protein